MLHALLQVGTVSKLSLYRRVSKRPKLINNPIGENLTNTTYVCPQTGHVCQTFATTS
jgi:hypothetical protein